MQKLDGEQRLPGNFTHLPDFKPFVAVVFDEVVQALAEWLEDETHVVGDLLCPWASCLVREPLLLVDDSPVAPALLL